MVAAAQVGLGIDEVQAIRDGLAAGRKPKVQFTESAGQIAGQIGQVIELGDPSESDEFVVVRFGRDELPFSPGDLRMAPRGAEPEPVVPAGPAFVLDQPVPVKASPVKAAAAKPVGDHDEAGLPAQRKGGDEVAAPRKAAARPAKTKPAPSLTVTLAYAEGEWTVAANQGAKALAKPYVIRPAEALRMVALVDVPGVQEAVEQIMSAERAEAESQAQRLRAELAEVEARLAELGEAG